MNVYRQIDGVSQVSMVKPGVFNATKDGARMIFVNSKTETDAFLPKFGEVFGVVEKGGGITVISSQSAEIKNARDDRPFLALDNGRQYMYDIQKDQMNSIRFGEYGFSMDEFLGKSGNKVIKDKPIEHMFPSELLAKNTLDSQAELFRKFSDAFMLLPVSVFAVFLGYVKPRTSSSSGLLVGIALFMLYLNLVKIAENRIRDDEMQTPLAFVLTHGVMLMLGILLMVYRSYSWRINLKDFLLRPFYKSKRNASS